MEFARVALQYTIIALTELGCLFWVSLVVE